MTCVVCRKPCPHQIDAPDGYRIAVHNNECLSEYLLIHYMIEQARKAGSVAHLTPTERTVYKLLSDADGAPVTYSDLVRATGGPDDEYGVMTLKTHVARLRRKLPPGTEIESVLKVGYRIKNGSRCLECGKPW